MTVLELMGNFCRGVDNNSTECDGLVMRVDVREDGSLVETETKVDRVKITSTPGSRSSCPVNVLKPGQEVRNTQIEELTEARLRAREVDPS